ncbi:MAG: hypothetical protein JXB18_00640 [Sedimentisphaerales bacterium]|nr:hypothetical protein [Sedimentisphaerales bacterium]
MDSKERHELMTNELAEWIAKLPGLIKEYRNQIIGIGLIIVGLISWPILNRWRAESDTKIQAEVSSVLEQLEMSKLSILRQQQEAATTDVVSTLLVTANNLEKEADKAPNDDLAAIALIKRGQALRTDLHYRKEWIAEDVISTQIKQAQESYEKALSKAKLPVIKAMALFGKGLCSEELGQLDQARDLYQKIVSETAFAGTPVAVLAQERINKMADNNAKYTFVDKPIEQPAAIQPQVQVLPATPESTAPSIQAAPAEQPQVETPAATDTAPAEQPQTETK